MNTAEIETAAEPVYAISEPRRITVGTGSEREVWWEVQLSNGYCNASQTLGAAKQFYREHRRPS